LRQREKLTKVRKRSGEKKRKKLERLQEIRREEIEIK